MFDATTTTLVLEAIRQAQNGDYARYPYHQPLSPPAHCGLVLSQRQDHLVAIFVELASNTGTTVTNAIESLAQLVYLEHALPLGLTLDAYVVVQLVNNASERHGFAVDRALLVEFDVLNGQFSNPRWSDLSYLTRSE